MSNVVVDPYRFKKSAVDIQFTDSGIDPSVTSSPSVSGLSLGAEPGAGETRHIAVEVSSQTNVTINSVTIAGQDATIIVQQGQSGGGPSAIAIAAVPAGTTGTVSASLSGNATGTSFGLCRMIGADPAPDVGQIDTAASDEVGPLDLSVSLPANGAAISCMFADDTTGSELTWTGIDKDYQENDGIDRHSGAHVAAGGGDSTLNVTADGAGSPASTAVLVAFAPAS